MLIRFRIHTDTQSVYSIASCNRQWTFDFSSFSIDNLRDRGAREEGILRVAGNKQKTEIIYNELEQNFYAKHDKTNGILKKAGPHDLSALLKRWLRELPTPLLANDLVHLFYQTAGEFKKKNWFNHFYRNDDELLMNYFNL